jgi:hypothetical protein
VYVPGRPGYVLAWATSYEELRLGVNERGEVVVELAGRGLPTIAIYVAKDKIRTVVADENYIAMHNHHDKGILRVAQAIVRKT